MSSARLGRFAYADLRRPPSAIQIAARVPQQFANERVRTRHSLGRRRAERALVTVVATAYLLGVSTHRVERLADQLGVKSLSRSQVSEMATHLDAQVTAFRQLRSTPAHTPSSGDTKTSTNVPGHHT
jgi:transposase-like protein